MSIAERVLAQFSVTAAMHPWAKEMHKVIKSVFPRASEDLEELEPTGAQVKKLKDAFKAAGFTAAKKGDNYIVYSKQDKKTGVTINDDDGEFYLFWWNA